MEFLKNLFGFAQAIDVGEIVTAILAILGGFSVLAKITPTKSDDKFIDAILNFINKLGLTKGKK